MNLGWVGAASSTTGYCTYYQWGRKDAFIPSTGTNNTNHTVYNISGNLVTTKAYSHTNDDNMTIGGNIQNPTVHNRKFANLGPCETAYYNMWDALQQTSNIEAAVATVKTIYDPCPPGFCVPTIGLYYHIFSQTRPEWNTGYTYSGVFFPAKGYRNGANGNLYSVGTIGYCWSATARYNTDGRKFEFYDSDWNLYGSNRALGCTVRAVAEDAEIVSPIPTLTGSFGDREGSYTNQPLPF